MKIAFTSCFDALVDPEQIVWDRDRAEAPEVLLLLGDTIYMDYFPHLGRPRRLSNQEVANEMYNRYKAQWGVEPFRKLIASVKRVGLTWDDHDFAWNGSCGAGTDRKNAVPQEKRRISKNLFLQFKHQVQQKPSTLAYPQQRPLDDLLTDNDTGIQESFDYGPVRIIMLDGRTYRECRRFVKNMAIRVRVLLKHLPLERHHQARKMAQLFEAIAQKDAAKAKKFKTMLFEQQAGFMPSDAERASKSVEEAMATYNRRVDADLKKAIEALGLNYDEIKKLAESDAVSKIIEADRAEAHSFGFTGTPAYLINGVPVRGALPATSFKYVIDGELAAKK